MGPRDLNSAPYSPVHCSSHSMTSFQSSELTELPVVENGQLFAQRAHSARYAPYVSTSSSTGPGGKVACRRESTSTSGFHLWYNHASLSAVMRPRIGH